MKIEFRLANYNIHRRDRDSFFGLDTTYFVLPLP